MYTKEEILSNTIKKSSRYLLDSWHAYSAMDEYAQQQAIAFDIWKLKNHWLWNSSICKYFKWEADNKHETNLSHEELYLQFIEHQKHLLAIKQQNNNP